MTNLEAVASILANSDMPYYEYNLFKALNLPEIKKGIEKISQY